MSILLSKDEQRESNNVRFDPKAGSPSESILDRCQPTSGPTAEEYHVLIKKGIVKFYYLINMGTWLRRIILHPPFLACSFASNIVYKIANDDLLKLA